MVEHEYIDVLEVEYIDVLEVLFVYRFVGVRLPPPPASEPGRAPIVLGPHRGGGG